MGLDMFLYARKSFSEYHPKQKEIAAKLKELAGFREPVIPGFPEDSKPVYVMAEVMYWRKANQIHKWFVDNVQEGNDNCGEYYIDRTDIEKLVLACDTAWVNKDTSILPPQSGFFFGSTDTDEWYWDQIRTTSKRLREILEDPTLQDASLFYQSSW